MGSTRRNDGQEIVQRHEKRSYEATQIGDGSTTTITNTKDKKAATKGESASQRMLPQGEQSQPYAPDEHLCNTNAIERIKEILCVFPYIRMSTEKYGFCFRLEDVLIFDELFLTQQCFC